jgi:lysophospholipase L1-like esterase
VSRWLAAATALRPDVASVVVGINDTLRGDFDPERTGAAVSRTVAALRAAGAEVLTMRLPDPGQMFGPAADQAGRGRLDDHQGHRVAGPAVP